MDHGSVVCCAKRLPNLFWNYGPGPLKQGILRFSRRLLREQAALHREGLELQAPPREGSEKYDLRMRVIE